MTQMVIVHFLMNHLNINTHTSMISLLSHKEIQATSDILIVGKECLYKIIIQALKMWRLMSLTSKHKKYTIMIIMHPIYEDLHWHIILCMICLQKNSFQFFMVNTCTNTYLKIDKWSMPESLIQWKCQKIKPIKYIIMNDMD